MTSESDIAFNLRLFLSVCCERRECVAVVKVVVLAVVKVVVLAVAKVVVLEAVVPAVAKVVLLLLLAVGKEMIITMRENK
jgi:hypothetical protein